MTAAHANFPYVPSSHIEWNGLARESTLVVTHVRTNDIGALDGQD